MAIYREKVQKWGTRLSARYFARISPDKLIAALQKISVGPSGVLFVHSSLAACGYFAGGPESVLDALGETCSTLCMPTHTYCYPEDPDNIAPLFDARSTPSKNGVLTEMFRKRTDVIRSIHSTHSLAAYGPLAREICTNHYKRDTPCGAATPYAMLVSLRASILLFGVSFHSYTLYHTAEDASGSEWAYEQGRMDTLRVINEEGEQRECLSRRQSRAPRRFRETGDLLEHAGLVKKIELGRSALLFVPDCSEVHDFLVERLRTTPDFLYQTCVASLR